MFGSSFGGELERSEKNEEVERGDSGNCIILRSGIGCDIALVAMVIRQGAKFFCKNAVFNHVI